MGAARKGVSMSGWMDNRYSLDLLRGGGTEGVAGAEEIDLEREGD